MRGKGSAYAIITGFTFAAPRRISTDPNRLAPRISDMPTKTFASAIYDGWVMHNRLSPVRHTFRYRVFALLLDLDELPRLSRLRLFSWNTPGIVGFHERDHGDGRNLRAWLDSLLAREGIVAGGAKRVLCYPRLFGYVFNPLSVWFCHGDDERLEAIVYEVHNTYGERHAYVLRANDQGVLIRQTCDKDFYVSPFLSPDCRYHFKIRPPEDDVLIAINETESEKPILTATFTGMRKPLGDAALCAMLLKHPLMTLKIIVAIHYEALRLMRKGVKRHAHVAPLRQKLPRGQAYSAD
jgi:DUF1365 family protein